MDRLLERMKRTISSHGLADPGEVILVAVSGGADSVALLLALWLLRDELAVSLRVAHVNHGLRGEESEREQYFVAELAGRLGLPFEAIRLDMAVPQGEHLGSLQEKARELRYQALEEAASRGKASRIAVGHHADDQTETVLENLLRGSGIEGLAGIPYRREKIVRPLLDATRDEIEDFLWRRGEGFCTDSSNLKPVYLRNRIRLELMPLLKGYNPNLVETLGRTAEIMRDEGELLDWMAASAAAELGILFDGESIRLPAAGLLERPTALRRRIVRLALQRLSGGLQGVSYSHVASLLELAANPESGRQVHLTRELQGRREYEWLVLERRLSPAVDEQWEYPLVIPGRTYIPELEAFIEADLRDPGALETRGPTNSNQAFLDFERLTMPICARRRRPGDRFYPLGAGGSQKVKEFLIDHKVPREDRERTAVVSSGDQVYWLAGWRADARFAANQETRRLLALSLSK
ncbi:MAG: tRNA lysidine(34) synthetase TilS [Firmicutes bacterium]|nr:tRNA lysidine(34) synthetase TilS [Bacillota bacterium]